MLLIERKKHTYKYKELKDDVQEAGKITGKARREIEEKIGKTVVEKTNYKTLTKGHVKNLTE